MQQQEHRYFGMAEKGGVIFFITSSEPISSASESGTTITHTDMKFWDQVDTNWFYQVVGETYVHVQQDEDLFSVRIMSGGRDDFAPSHYDSFAEAIVRGQIEIDRLEDERFEQLRNSQQG